MPKAKMITYGEKTQSINAWARELGLKPITLHSRLQRGASIEEAFNPDTKVNYKDLSGLRFGKLFVLERLGSSDNQKSLFSCLCECGEVTVAIGGNLTQGFHTSCGCQKNKGVLKHGYGYCTKRPRVYSIWAGMLDRCNNSNSPNFKNYGGRGIFVCDRWRKFENFLKDMGIPEDDESIDRINNEGSYTPSNCKWSTDTEQNRNTRKNRYLTFEGQTKCVAEWSEITGIGESLIRSRLDKLGWSIEKSLSTPVNNNLIRLSWNNKEQSLWAWSKELNVAYSTLQNRLRQGWSVERALTEPVRQR